MKKGEDKIEKMGFVEAERHGMRTLSPADKELALEILASHPVKPYLIAVIDELVRQGIYLSLEEQEGAKMLVKVIGSHLELGKKLLDKKEKRTKSPGQEQGGGDKLNGQR